MQRFEENLKKLRKRIPGLSLIGYLKDGKPFLLYGMGDESKILDELKAFLENSRSLVKDLGGGRLKEIYLRGAFCEIVAVMMEEELGFAVVQSTLPLAFVLREVKKFFANISLLSEKREVKKAPIKEDEIESFLDELTLDNESAEEKT